MDGIPAEYAYLNTKYGKRGDDYLFMGQVLTSGNGRKFDLLNIKPCPTALLLIFTSISPTFSASFNSSVKQRESMVLFTAECCTFAPSFYATYPQLLYYCSYRPR